MNSVTGYFKKQTNFLLRVVGSTNNFGNGDKNNSDLWIIKTDQIGFVGSLNN